MESASPVDKGKAEVIQQSPTEMKYIKTKLIRKYMRKKKKKVSKL